MPGQPLLPGAFDLPGCRGTAVGAGPAGPWTARLGVPAPQSEPGRGEPARRRQLACPPQAAILAGARSSRGAAVLAGWRLRASWHRGGRITAGQETIRFYQEFLGFPLVELVENRDYAGSNHFFFDIGNHNLLGFFDFPGHDHPAFTETIGGVQHLAISISAEQFEAAKKKLDQAGIDYLGPDRGVMDSMYFRDPNGIGLELYQEELGIFNGHRLLA